MKHLVPGAGPISVRRRGGKNPQRFPVQSCKPHKEGGTGRLHSDKFQVLFSKYCVGYEADLFQQNYS